MHNSHKGQIWTMDFAFGLMAFAFMLLLFMMVWNDVTMRWRSTHDYTHMQSAAIFASEALLATPGEPASWETLPAINESSVSALGLANGRNELNSAKLNSLCSQNSSAYTFVRDRLGLATYEFGFTVMDIERENTLWTFGKFPGINSTSTMVERMGIIANEPVIVKLVVWK